MSNYHLTCLAIFGMLLIGAVASSSSTLFPVTKIVSATPTSGANETGSSNSNNMTGAT